jgi:serine protease
MNARTVIFAAGLFVLLVVAAGPAESLAGVNGGKSALTAKSEPMPVNQIIVKYKKSADLATAAVARTPERMQRMSETAGVALGYFRPMSGEAHVLRLPQRMEINHALETCSRLATLSDVEYAEPDYIMLPFGNSAQGALVTPNDPQYNNQWHYFAPGAGHYGVNAPAAWDITTGSASIYAAVIDTGILNHADLSNRWIGGYDFITDPTMANDGGGRDASPLDPGDWVAANECYTGSGASDSSWHGTHVAGTIGAASNNGVGVAGLNWVSKVVPLRVLGKCGGTTSDIADAMRWSAGLTVTGVPANTHPAKVANMSLGGSSPTCPATYQNAVNDLIAAGSVLVVAAGNSNADASGFSPANCTGVITVAATNRDGGRSSYSNFGSVVEVAAPGGETYPTTSNGILSTLNSGTTSPVSDSYVYYQGTSMAAPHVAGVVSLMFSVNSSLTPTQVMNILQSTVTPFPAGSSCTTSICGSGIVNAQAAVAMAQSVNGPPTVISTNPANSATGVSVSSAINAVFSKPMNAATITTSTFTLNNGVTGSVSYDPATLTATFTPSASLSYNTTYTATITTGVTDSGGVHMVAPKTWSFTTQGVNVFQNGGFESGATGWTQVSNYNLFYTDGAHSRTGSGYAWLGGYEYETDVIYQDITIPAAATGANTRFWFNIDTEETSLSTAWDTLTVTINNPTNDDVLQTLGTLSNLDATGGSWEQFPQYDLIAYKGQTVRLKFTSYNDVSNYTYFFLDDVEFNATMPMSTLKVYFPGNGTGTVTINPGNIACNTNYTGQFADGALLTLTGDDQDYSDFNNFTGDCTSNPCSLTMNGPKNVNANIAKDTVHKALIGASNYFSTLPTAYSSTVGTVIKAWGTYFAEPLTCNLVKNVTIDGGYNDGYSAKSGYTLLQGPLTIGRGSLTVENLTIK